jgi:hypothetical protein
MSDGVVAARVDSHSTVHEVVDLLARATTIVRTPTDYSDLLRAPSDASIGE